MSLLTLLDAQLAHGHWPLLDHAEFALAPGLNRWHVNRHPALHRMKKGPVRALVTTQQPVRQICAQTHA